jgi:hypothetical protein
MLGVIFCDNRSSAAFSGAKSALFKFLIESRSSNSVPLAKFRNAHCPLLNARCLLLSVRALLLALCHFGLRWWRPGQSAQARHWLPKA